MSVHVNIGGVWKTAANVYNNIGGVWKTATDMPVNIGGAWKTGILANPGYDSIATLTSGAGATNVTFTSIPQTYTHLQLMYFAAKTDTGITDITLEFNGDGGANYRSHWVFTFDGGGVYNSANSTAMGLGYLYGNDGPRNAGIIDIFDYTKTTQAKSTRFLTGSEKISAGTSTLIIGSGLWKNTSAITSIKITGSATMVTGSKFYLFGIK